MGKNTRQRHVSRADLNVSSTNDYAHTAPFVVRDGESGDVVYDVEVRKYEAHSGPIPSPEVMKEYDNIVPGAAERILRMAEKQLDHNIAYDQKSLKCVDNSAKRGQWFGFILTILLIGAGFWLALEGHTTVSCVIFGTAIAAVVGAFVSNLLKLKKNKS